MIKLEPNFNASPPRRVAGKVYVSHIVDYLRHTTSRSSQDSGLEELCNMLDPEHKDVSIDLDTYHAVMREWIDDCRNNGWNFSNQVVECGSVPWLNCSGFFCGRKRENLCREP